MQNLCVTEGDRQVVTGTSMLRTALLLAVHWKTTEENLCCCITAREVKTELERLVEKSHQKFLLFYLLHVLLALPKVEPGSNQTISVCLKKNPQKHIKSFRAFPWLLHILIGEEGNLKFLWSETPCRNVGLVSKNSEARFVPKLAKVFSSAPVIKPSSSWSSTWLSKPSCSLPFHIIGRKVPKYCPWLFITAVLYW